MKKVTKSYEILSENDINNTLDKIQKSIETLESAEKNFRRFKKEILTYRKMDVNIFKHEALKNMLEVL